jgi:hypothetical protein
MDFEHGPQLHRIMSLIVFNLHISSTVQASDLIPKAQTPACQQNTSIELLLLVLEITVKGCTI